MLATSSALGLDSNRLLLKGLAADPTAYQDLSRLARSGNTEASLDAAARAFEALLVGQILKQMRSAALSDGLFDSAYTSLYQELYDQQIAALISEGDGLGIRKFLMRQWASRLEQKTPAEQRDPSELIVPERNPWLKPIRPQARPRVGQEQTQVSNQETQTGSGQMQVAALGDALSSAAKTTGGWPPRNAEEFVAYLKPYAEQAAAVLGMDTSILLAQSALETGWGRSIPRRPDGRSSFNLFGIKADRSWQGDSVAVGTLEYRDGVARREQARFRAYDSPAESFIDYVAFLRRNPRYREALQSRTAEDFIRGLQRAGYATDPRYADKVLALRARVLALSEAKGTGGEGTEALQPIQSAALSDPALPTQPTQVSVAPADEPIKG